MQANSGSESSSGGLGGDFYQLWARGWYEGGSWSLMLGWEVVGAAHFSPLSGW